MREPKLKNVNKIVPPYRINSFPDKFILKFGEELVYMLSTREPMALEGNDWEHVFADCIDAEWKPSNVGLDDVRLGNACWSAKTVFANTRNIASQKEVRLVCGRNSPTYSFGQDKITEENPNEIGKMVLEIWNARVDAIRQIFKFTRTVVLVKSKDFSDFLVFENETVRYDPELYDFFWNDRGNLEGNDKRNEKHKFTWQPHGSQFTVIEEIPRERLHLRLKKPQKLDKQTVLAGLGFNRDWIIKVED